jgi:chromosome segregation ATPase
MPVLLLLLLSALTASCALVGADRAAPDAAASPAQLGEAISSVSERRRAADEEVDRALGALRRADEAIARARRAPLVAQGLEEGLEVREELADLAPDRARDELRDLAGSIDAARTLVATLQASTPEDAAWRHRYLAAQDEVLRNLREHAAAGDALLQLVDRHRVTYDAALEVFEEIAEEREDHDDRSAADAVDEALDGFREPLRLAREELAEYQDRRRETGRRVNEAAADAATILDQRTDG